MPIAAMPGASSQTSGSPPARLISAADAEDDDGRDQPRQQQRRGGQQGAGQAGRAQQPRRETLDRAGAPPPHLGGDAGPDPPQVDAARRSGAQRRTPVRLRCRRSSESPSEGGAQEAAGTVRAALHRALGDAGQPRHLGDRPVLDVHELPHLAVGRAERADRGCELRTAAARTGRDRPGGRNRAAPAVPGSSRSGRARWRARVGGAAARPGGGRSPTARRPPSPRGGSDPAPFHAARKVSCSTSSTSDGGSTARSRAASIGACRANSSRSAVSSPPARRVISSSSSIASLLHTAAERFATAADPRAVCGRRRPVSAGQLTRHRGLTASHVAIVLVT